MFSVGAELLISELEKFAMKRPRPSGTRRTKKARRDEISMSRVEYLKFLKWRETYGDLKQFRLQLVDCMLRLFTAAFCVGARRLSCEVESGWRERFMCLKRKKPEKEDCRRLVEWAGA